MVGGYLIFDDRPFIIGENDLVSRYGSYENAYNRILTLGAIQKPVMIRIKYDAIDVPVVTWVNAVGNPLTLKGSGITGLLSVTASKITLTLSQEE